MNSSEKEILCSGDIAAECKLSDISSEKDVIFEERYAGRIQKYLNNANPIYQG